MVDEDVVSCCLHALDGGIGITLQMQRQGGGMRPCWTGPVLLLAFLLSFRRIWGQHLRWGQLCSFCSFPLFCKHFRLFCCRPSTFQKHYVSKGKCPTLMRKLLSNLATKDVKRTHGSILRMYGVYSKEGLRQRACAARVQTPFQAKSGHLDLFLRISCQKSISAHITRFCLGLNSKF